MKYSTLIIWIFLFLSAVLFVQTEANEILFVKITDVSPEKLSNLIILNVDISNVKNNNVVFAYISTNEYDQLINYGYQIEVLPDRAKMYADSLWLATKDSRNPLDAYHTYDELTTELHQLEQQYSEIFLLESAGKSLLGRDLWVVKITDNVKIEECEPEFKYIASMHGDEPVGMEMCIYFIRHLLENYRLEPRITAIVDETEIWIMPLMNPDGYIAHQRRNNANIDLNRNFPDRINDPINTTEGREPETQVVMNFCNEHSFILSANFHTGALVTNYPYDSNETGYNVYTACPDDPLFIELCKTYSSFNLPMWNSPYFPFGITNGADWYVMYGGMQDWNYVWLGCNEVTIELSDNKWPNASLLPSFWDNNRESMLSYLEAIHWGVRGVISDSISGLPLSANIEVIGIDHKVYTDPDHGDYYRMLLPGMYTLKFSIDGYCPKVVDSVFVIDDYMTYLDVQLQPYLYLLDLDFELDDGYLSASDTVWQWGTPDYGPQHAYSGRNLWGTRLPGSYPNECDASLILPPTILPDASNLILTFWHWMEAEVDNNNQGKAFDGGIVEISSDNDSSWTQIHPLEDYPLKISEATDSSPFTPNTPVFSGKYGWREELFDLTSFKGKSVRIRFHFGSDRYNEYPLAGWYVDNIAIKYAGTRSGVSTSKTNSSPEHFSLLQNYPNPFNSATTIPFTLLNRSQIRITVFNIMGQIIRILVDQEKSPGKYQISWNGCNFKNQPVTSGVYIIQMESEDKLLTRKVLLLR